MKKLVLLFFIYSSFVQAEICMGPNLKIDESCKCGPSCDSFYDPEYMQILKNSKMDKKRLNTILQYQKATGSAYTKLMRGGELTTAELANVDKESQAMAKWNASSLAQLNGMLAKKKKPKIDLEKSLKAYDQRFMASLSPKLREGMKNPGPLRVNTPNTSISSTNTPGADETTNTETAEPVGLDLEAKVVDSPTEELNEADFAKLNIKEDEHIIEDQRASLFVVLSKSYKKMQEEDRIKKFHVDSEEDKAFKKEMIEDIKVIIRKDQ